MTRELQGVLLVLLGTCAAISTAVAEETLRCGNKLISLGMSRAEVLAQCGEPKSRDVEVQDVRSANQVVGKTEVQRWTYTSYGATRVLVFDQEKLKSIE